MPLPAATASISWGGTCQFSFGAVSRYAAAIEGLLARRSRVIRTALSRTLVG